MFRARLPVIHDTDRWLHYYCHIMLQGIKCVNVQGQASCHAWHWQMTALLLPYYVTRYWKCKCSGPGYLSYMTLTDDCTTTAMLRYDRWLHCHCHVMLQGIECVNVQGQASCHTWHWQMTALLLPCYVTTGDCTAIAMLCYKVLKV